MMAASYAPNESHNDILTERAFLAGDLITGAGYGQSRSYLQLYDEMKLTDLQGMQVILYISCARHLLRDIKQRKNNSLYILVYITGCMSGHYCRPGCT